jgi:hypothetical protein
MDAVNQYLDVVKNWTDGQVKTGQGWFEAVQKMERFDPALIWAQSLEAYKASVQGTLDAEVAGSKVVFNGLAAIEGLPAEAGNLVKQIQGASEQITHMQQSLVDNWFELLGKIDLSKAILPN